jgi:hypothetical protein
MAHSLMDGTCGRRAMMPTSMTRNTTIAPMVIHQVVAETSNGQGLPVTMHEQATGGLSRPVRAPLGPDQRPGSRPRGEAP